MSRSLCFVVKIQLVFSSFFAAESFTPNPLSQSVSLHAPDLAYSNGAVFDPSQTDTLQNFRKVMSVTKAQDLHEFLGEDDRLCVVKVYANWCKICKKFDLRYKKLAKTDGDRVDAHGVIKPGRVRFAEMEFSTNEELCRSLGATKLPYILLYKGATSIEDAITHFQAGPSQFQVVVNAVNKYADKLEDIVAKHDMERHFAEAGFERVMARGSALGDQIVQQLSEELGQKTPIAKGGWTPFEEFCYGQSSKLKDPRC